MKCRIAFFFFCIVVLNACSPQVTVTSEVTVTSTPPLTETPLPTPTPHPDYLALQDQIAASGERFVLMPNGTIQDGAETVPGLTVAPDGTMTLTVNGETVTLDPADVNFDDETGISIEGYDWDEDQDGWVEAVSEAMQAAEQHFADLGYATDGVEFVEGEVTVTGRVDGFKVFEMNIKSGEFMFDQEYVEKQASQMKLDPSDLGPYEDVLKATGKYHLDDRDWNKVNEEYVKPLKEQFNTEYGIEIVAGEGRSVSFVMLDPEINAWGTILKMNYKDPKAPRYLYYRDEAGKGYIVPLIPEK